MIKQGKAKFTNPQGGAAVKVRVNTKAKQNRVESVDLEGGLVTIDLKCGKGKVNEELSGFLCDLLDVKKKDIEILSGATPLDKVVCVLGQSVEVVNEALKKAN